MNCQNSIKLTLQDMMDKLDNNLENIDAIKFLEKLDDIFKNEISQEDINHLKNFCATGYFNKIIIRVKLLEKEIKESFEYKIKELENKIEKLQNEKTVLVVEIEDLKKNVKELGKKNTQLDADLIQLQKNVGNLEDKITSLENSNTHLQTENKQLQKDVENLEDKITSLENSNTHLKTENKQLQKDVENLEDKITNLENSNTHLKTENKQFQKDVENLEDKITNLENSNTHLKTENKQFQKDVENLEDKITNLENDNKCFKKSLNQLLNDNFSRGQDLIDQKDILKNIKERDNYKSILYIILISAGGSFDKIHKNIRSSYFQLYNNINRDLDELYCEAKSFLNKGNNNAHSSSKSNIFKNLFPLYNEKYGSKFNDNIINKVKKLISDLNEPEEKNDKNELNMRMEEISKEIKKIFES